MHNNPFSEERGFNTLMVKKICGLFILLALVSLVILQPSEAALPALRQAATINIGAAVQPQYLQNEPAYRDTFAREFNTLIPENAMTFAALSPARGQYNFANADTLVNFAASNSMKMRGQPLVWYDQVPDWFKNGTFSRDQSIAILREYIAAVVGRYKGRIAEWDVVMDAFDDSQAALRQSIWAQRIGQDYVEIAFRAAREADPNALLFISDYGNEGMGGKSDVMFNAVQYLVGRGVPINGVALQLHTSLASKPNPANVTANMARYAALGLKVEITAMDVRVQDAGGVNPANLDAQAQVYRDMLDVCLKASNCVGFNTWGFTDKYTRTQDAALLFDQNYQPKPAYNALAERLSGQSPTQPTPIPPTPAPPTPIPDKATVIVNVQPNGSTVNVAINLVKVSNLYGLETRCTVNPAVLTGTTRNDGAGFNASNSIFVDQGFKAQTGEWLVAASLKRPATPINGDATAYSLSYTVSSAGSSPVNCAVLGVDATGKDVPLDVINGSYSGGTQPTPTTPPVQPTAIPTQPVPTFEPTQPVPTIEPTIPVVTLEPTPGTPGTISGSFAYQNSPDNAGITIELLSQGTPAAQVVTGANGAFQFTDVPAGTYTIRASAPQHLGFTQDVTVDTSGQPVTVETVTLMAGDTDDNGTIDVTDASFVGANYSLAAPPAPSTVDLNRDQQVNISDLVLVGGNFGRTSSNPGQ